MADGEKWRMEQHRSELINNNCALFPFTESIINYHGQTCVGLRHLLEVSFAKQMFMVGRARMKATVCEVRTKTAKVVSSECGDRDR